MRSEGDNTANTDQRHHSLTKTRKATERSEPCTCAVCVQYLDKRPQNTAPMDSVIAMTIMYNLESRRRVQAA